MTPGIRDLRTSLLYEFEVELARLHSIWVPKFRAQDAEGKFLGPLVLASLERQLEAWDTWECPP